jgi:serine-type D-Ala-D-Ala carboxypeptidase (penicillin-binding protein 5/6)
MSNTNIVNSSGWPHPAAPDEPARPGDPGAAHAQRVPAILPYLAEREFTWNNITQPNRLPLIGAGLGLDGLKTGHTRRRDMR